MAFKILLVLATLYHGAVSRTTRYEIVTKPDGTKEVVNTSTGKTAPSDLNFLINDENQKNKFFSTPSKPLETKFFSATEPLEENLVLATAEPAVTTETLETAQLNQLNSYTANGWTAEPKSVFVNSTKLVVLDGPAVEIHHHEKQGRAEVLSNEITESATKDQSVVEVPIDQPGLWEAIERLYHCFSDFGDHGGRLTCVKTRVTRMMLNFLDYSFGASEKREVFEQKTLTHGKKLLRGALLPILVLLVIKYLIALPVIAAGLVTIKTFWLSLLSAGVAAFGAPWKEPAAHYVKRWRPEVEQTWVQPPGWTTAIHTSHDKIGNTGTEKYFM